MSNSNMPDGGCPRCGKDDWIRISVVEVVITFETPTEDDNGETTVQNETSRWECGHCGYEVD